MRRSCLLRGAMVFVGMCLLVGCQRSSLPIWDDQTWEARWRAQFVPDRPWARDEPGFAVLLALTDMNVWYKWGTPKTQARREFAQLPEVRAWLGDEHFVIFTGRSFVPVRPAGVRIQPNAVAYEVVPGWMAVQEVSADHLTVSIMVVDWSNPTDATHYAVVLVLPPDGRYEDAREGKVTGLDAATFVGRSIWTRLDPTRTGS